MLESSDGVHPNAAGDQFIAQQVGPKLVQFVKDVRGASSGGGGGGSSPVTTATTAAPSPTSGVCAALYGQCGGSGYSGATCCAQGTCKAANEYYSQCV